MFENWVIITRSAFGEAAKKLSEAYGIPVWGSQDPTKYDFGGVEGVIIIDSAGYPINANLIPFLEANNIPYKTIHSNSTDATSALNSILKYIDNTFLLQNPPTAPQVDPYLRLEEERQRAEWEKWVTQNSFEIKNLFKNWGMEITDSQILDLAKGVNRTLVNLYQALATFEPYREIYHQYYGRNPFEGEELQSLVKKLETSPFKGTAEIIANIAKDISSYWQPPEAGGEGMVTTPAMPSIIQPGETLEAYKNYVVLVRSDSDVDLEAANFLAETIGGKVIRVSPSGRLTDAQLNEISGSAGAFIVGGAKSISLDLDEALMREGILARRFFGETPEETAGAVQRFIEEEVSVQRWGSRATELIKALQATFATPQEFGRFIEASEKVGAYGEIWQELMEKELGVRMSFEEMQEALMGRAGYGSFEDLLKRAQASYKLRWARTQGVKF